MVPWFKAVYPLRTKDRGGEAMIIARQRMGKPLERTFGPMSRMGRVRPNWK